MFCCKKSSQTGCTCSILGHDAINCEKECCKDKKRIDRCESFLVSCEELTKPKALAEQPSPLSHAFALTVELSKLKDKNIEAKSELKTFSKRCKQFTVDLLDECKSDEEVAAVFDFEQNDPDREKKIVGTLKKAIDANHKEVYIVTSIIACIMTNSIVIWCACIIFRSCTGNYLSHLKRARTNRLEHFIKYHTQCTCADLHEGRVLSK